ncbi:MAG: hypothetical protein WBV82_02630 [Myxococcaceae bacterium]
MQSKKRQQKLAGVVRRISSDVELLVDELERLRPELLERAAPPHRFKRWGVLFGASLAIGAVGALMLRRMFERTVIDEAAPHEEGITATPRDIVTDHA